MSADAVAYMRDWVIIIFGFAATIAALVFLVVTIVLYRKVSGIINAILATAQGVRDFTKQVAEQLGTLTPILGFFSRRKRQGKEEHEEVKETRQQDGDRSKETIERRRETKETNDGHR